MGHLTRAAPVLLVASSLVACGGGNGSGRLRGTTTATVVEAPVATVDSYRTEATPEAAIGGEPAAAVERGVVAAGQSRGVEMSGDGRLGLLAAWTAERLGEGGTPPPHEVVEFFAHHVGLVEPVPHLLILGQPDASALEAGITDSVAQFLGRQAYNRYGVAVVERQGLTIAVVTLAGRWVELEPVPRHLSAGESIRVSGSLLDGYQNPTFAVAPPEGAVRRIPAGGGPDFQVNIPTEGRGVYKVEILAQGPRGDTVLANFPLYVGVPVPRSVAVGGTAGPGESRDALAVGTELLRQLNETREQQGLAPLARHEGVAAVALAHSRDMVDNGFVGHRSAASGNAPDRVRAAGLRSGLVLENIGRGYGAAEIHRGLIDSPGHRANVLNGDVTHVGIGVVGEPEGSRTAFVATQVFVRMAQEIDVAAAPAELIALINQGREARGARPLEGDQNLSAAAQQAAQDYFGDGDLTQQDAVDQASGQMRRFAIAFRRVGGLMVVVSTVDEASQLEPTFDPEVRYVGIGVAQGNREDHPPNSIAVVILLGWAR